MAESSDQTALQRRAIWVGLKTLRQRPKLVGETKTGDPVFEVRSVRMILRDEAGHFSRLAECSKCGREVPGSPVVGPADLDRPSHSMICKDCVRASVAASPLQPERRPAKPDPPPAPAAEAEVRSAQPTASEDVRLGAVEAQLQMAMSRLAELADVKASSEAGAGDDDQAGRSVEALTQVVQAQQRQLVSLSAGLDETRAELQQLTESNRELSRAKADLERRIDDVAGKAGADAAGLEHRLQGEVARLRQLVETLRGEIEAPLGAPVQHGMTMVIEGIQELARARDEVTTSLEALLGGARDAEARMATLASAIEDGGSRLRALELRMQQSVDRLTGALEAHRRELKVAGAANGRLDRPAEPSAAGEPTASLLLDGLERQLQEAEGRLARLHGSPGAGAGTTGQG